MSFQNKRKFVTEHSSLHFKMFVIGHKGAKHHIKITLTMVFCTIISEVVFRLAYRYYQELFRTLLSTFAGLGYYMFHLYFIEMDTKGFNDLCHHKEQPTTQNNVTNTHNEDQEQGHREVKVWDARPRNMKRLNEIHYIGEQHTTLLHDKNLHRLINKNHNLKKEQEDLQKKKEELLEKIKAVKVQKEKETVQRLQCEGQLCDLNCVSLAILWICKHKLESMSSFCCAPHFETLITLHAFLEKKLSHIPRCGYFMNTLQNVGIVRKVYECEMNGILEINEAWETIMKMNKRVCILAKGKAEGVGHAVVCDLDTRTSKTKDGKVMFHDRQALPSSGQRRVEMSLQKFIEYVNNVILMLYTVDLEGFNRKMVYYKDVLHITELPHSCPRIE